MTDAAKQAWQTVYGELTAAKYGLLDAVTARAEAQTARIAMVYALLDGCPQTDVRHLKVTGANGLSKTEAHTLLGRNKSAECIVVALDYLVSRGFARRSVRTSGRKPAEVWVAIYERTTMITYPGL